jgi:proteasome lid subunit RPN8/RPN11
MSPPLEWPAALLARLVALAEASPRAEVCGLVVEGPAGDLEAWPCANAAPDPGRAFEIAPREILAAMRRLDASGARLVAVYHSHPFGGTSLSRRDLEACLVGGQPLLPGVEQLVLSLSGGRAIAAWAHGWEAGRFEGHQVWPGQPTASRVTPERGAGPASW